MSESHGPKQSIPLRTWICCRPSTDHIHSHPAFLSDARQDQSLSHPSLHEHLTRMLPDLPQTAIAKPVAAIDQSLDRLARQLPQRQTRPPNQLAPSTTLHHQDAHLAWQSTAWLRLRLRSQPQVARVPGYALLTARPHNALRHL